MSKSGIFALILILSKSVLIIDCSPQTRKEPYIIIHGPVPIVVPIPFFIRRKDYRLGSYNQANHFHNPGAPLTYSERIQPIKRKPY